MPAKGQTRSRGTVITVADELGGAYVNLVLSVCSRIRRMLIAEVASVAVGSRNPRTLG